MTKFWLDFDQKIFTPTDLKIGTWPRFTTPKNINFTPNFIQPWWLGGKAVVWKQNSLYLGGSIPWRVTPMLWFVSFKFGHVQLLSFVVVMVWSDSFSYLESVQWILLKKFRKIKNIELEKIGKKSFVIRFLDVFAVLF